MPLQTRRDPPLADASKLADDPSEETPAAAQTHGASDTWDGVRTALETAQQERELKAKSTWAELVKKYGPPDDPTRSGERVIRSAKQDSFAADLHLAYLDPWLLLALCKAHHDLRELEDVVAHHNDLCAVLVDETGITTPVDLALAERRRASRPCRTGPQ